MIDDQPAAEAAEVEEKSGDVADQFAAADEQADPVEAPSIEEVAAEIGWTPRDKFRGPPEKWKPADRFILDGKDIQERTSRELKEMRNTLDTVARTSGAILQERLADERARLAQHYANAVEQGDPDAAWRAANAIQNLDHQATVAQPRRGPEPETEQWVAKNGRVMADPIAAKRALGICDEYARAGFSTADQLQRTEVLMRREFPHLFDDKAAPQVSAPGSRSTAGNGRGDLTFESLPAKAKEIAKDYEERLGIPRAQYLKHYIAEVEKRKQA